ncbi:MAG: extracellular solute-binding protein [Microbacterium sp.]|uniref:extracellular solute-binding protein n=1 Tax=Microbacterium sp. TaxID=51671 RepID=UPI0039E4A0FA
MTALGVVLGLSACAGSGSTDTTITVMYEKTSTFTQLDDLMQTAKAEFEAANPGVTVELQAISAGDDDYKTKLALANRSASTAPDVFYEDSLNVRADAEAGYLLPLDDRLSDWGDWDLFEDAAKQAGIGTDGQTYAVSLGTDTRVIWYDTSVFEAAGIATPWQPTSWQDILDTAATIKSAEPDVIPFNMYAGTSTTEGSVISGFDMLLYGTELGDDALFDSDTGKWVVGSDGFVDSLTFLDELWNGGLATTAAQALDSNVWSNIFDTWFPDGQIGAMVEGSYVPSFWAEDGQFPWSGYSDVMQTAYFPTQTGEEPGYVSMSGGWTLAVGAQTANPDLAFDFLTTALSKDNALSYDVANSQIAVRSDVASESEYLDANPYVEAVSDAVAFTHFRPTTSDYSAISTAIQNAMESVITGSATPQEAAATYDAAVVSAVGEDGVIQK